MERLSKILLVLLIVLTGIFVYVLIWGLSFPFCEQNESQTFLPVFWGDNLAEYEKFCTELNISQAVNNPSSLIGHKVKVQGQIIRKEEFQQFNKTRTYMRTQSLRDRTRNLHSHILCRNHTISTK